MTKEEFKKLQQQQQESGQTLKSFLQELGVGYSTWSYWRRKYEGKEPVHELAPISISKSHHPTTFSCTDDNAPTGATLLFPNGLRAHFGKGSEGVLMELLHESLSPYVQS